MNWLDRMVASVAPERGLRRVRARAAMTAMLSYEGARKTRRTDGWITGGTSANAEIGPSLAGLRERSRDLVRNNPWANHALEEMVGNVIGAGILCQSKTGSDALDVKLDALWSRFADECDADGQLDLYGLQDLIERCRGESGETLIRLRARRPDDGFAVPLQIQVLEPDHLDLAKSGMNGGNAIIQGVEYDPISRRVAYWLFPTHPGDVLAGLGSRGLQSVRVPAESVIHVYRKLRPGQGRGVPMFAPVVVKARDLDELCEAFMVRKKVEACLSAFRFTPDGDDSAPIGIAANTVDGAVVESFEPGMIAKLGPGEDIRFIDPSSSGGIADYLRFELHAIAAGCGVTYQGMTGDLSQVNYSSYKAGRITFNRLCESVQWKTIIPQFCSPLRRRFVDTVAVALPAAAGKYGAEWSPPRFESVDPLKDANADLVEVRSGFTTLEEVIRRRGFDPKRQLATIKSTNDALDADEIVLDSDPRKVAKSGSTQATPQESGGQQDVDAA